MRVLIVADTHGLIDPRIVALAAGCDQVAHAGDVGSAAVLGDLRNACPRVAAVCGNNDVPAKWAGAERSILDQLPQVAELSLPGGVLVIVHGDTFPAKSRHAGMRMRYPAARAIAYGHSHRIIIDDNVLPWVINPGAAGRTRTYGGPSGLILEADADRWQVEAVRFPPLV
ncbi:metallophosphoesterase family protein [Tahibacter amnicola]|uniref:Phosphoesterase n=1 Tax=Tahibacter amnicola TaxID=2976241 RepID=A0ABY6BAS3_9GAMM|nr:metallophosphoesterase family protein [Tahibacter amnicola]UXI66902.1 metallophosphatase family protein [Tahibacter amnicola]